MRKLTPVLAFCAALAFATFFSCKKDRSGDPEVVSGKEVLELPETPYQYFQTHTQSNKIATLGRVLFYDKHLSVNNSVSCAGCHKQEFAFADNVAHSRGFENRLTSRNSMPLINLPFGDNIFGNPVNLFWDGRAASLVDLIMKPIGNHVEMGISDVATLPGKLQNLSYYPALFHDAFGDSVITTERISESVAVFVSSIRSDSSKFDRRQKGGDVFNAQEAYGMVLFDNKYNCRSCHSLDPVGVYGGSTPTFTGPNFVDLGLDPVASDKGRGVISGVRADDGKFRIPNLHNVALTAPYMHDGRLATLEQVIDHYSHGIVASANLDSRLKGQDGTPTKMNISADEKKALIAFLNTLTDHKTTTDPKFSNPFKIQQ